MFLVVEYIEATGNDLISRGVEVSEIWHIAPGKGRVPGLDPQRRSYFSRASFADPDGNTWTPCRKSRSDSRAACGTPERWPSSCARRLSTTARSRQSAPPYDWWDWYGAYVDAREQGLTPDEASAAAGRYMADIKHIVVASA